MVRIAARKREHGSIGYTARVRIRKGGKIVFTQAQTFDREAAAKAMEVENRRLNRMYADPDAGTC